MVLFPQSYDSLLPPVKFKGDDANNQSLAVIMGTFTVLDLIQLDDVESTFDIFFKLDVHWYDVNLKYQFLHDLDAKNAFGTEALARMWKPSIQFFHIDKNDEVIDMGYTLFVQKGTGSVRLSGGLDTLHVHEVYAGTENPIFLKFRKKMKFFCPFENIKNYPFGKEKCSLHFYIRGIANRLTEFDCRMVAPEYQSVGQYVVSLWTIGSSERDGEKVISVTMTLDRSFSSIFLVTYLPTVTSSEIFFFHLFSPSFRS